MRFVLANVLLFSIMSGTLYYQYFFQGPESKVQASFILSPRTPAAAPAELIIPLEPASLRRKKLIEDDWKFSLNCKNSEQTINRESDSLILNIKKCEKEFPNSIIVENESNGFTASVFSIGQTSSRTDSIPLKKGKNVIVIKYQLAKPKMLSKTVSKLDAKSEGNSDIVEKLIFEH